MNSVQCKNVRLERERGGRMRMTEKSIMKPASLSSPYDPNVVRNRYKQHCQSNNLKRKGRGSDVKASECIKHTIVNE